MVYRRLPIGEIEEAQEEEGKFRTKSGLLVDRVAIWGVVVRKIEREKSTFLLIDDFTGTIPVVSFLPVKVEEGDVVRVFGRLDRRDDSVRIVADIVRKISPKEELLHRLDNLLSVLPEEEEVEVVELL